MGDLSRIQTLQRFRDKHGIPAVFGGVINASGELDLDAVGIQRRGYEQAVKTSDLVHIGSCCKMITALLFGTFVDEQRADWEMPVTDLFPDLADSIAQGWHNCTVAALFYCLGGMRANPPHRFLTSGHTDTRPLTQQRTEMTELAFSQAPDKPGRFVYSNMGYIVLGAAIDRLSGVSFERALEDRVLQPLGITHAGYGPPPDVWGHAPKFVCGGLGVFKGKPADPHERSSDNPPVLSAAGTLHLSCVDWARILHAFQIHNSPGIVSEQVIERILHLPQSKAARMSMGWAPVELHGMAYGAQGSNLRWSATVLMDDTRQRISLLVCNDGRSRVLRQSVSIAHRLLTTGCQ
ncbi:MAG: serine hydrolase domain-containing protein [bacterium]